MVRLKNRYFLVELRWEGKQPEGLTAFHLSNEVKKSVSLNFGEYGAALLLRSLAGKYYNTVTNLAIVRSDRDHHKMTWLALNCINEIWKQRVAITIIHVGGSIKACQKVGAKYDKKLLELSKQDTREDDMEEENDSSEGSKSLAEETEAKPMEVENG
eukprot:TRINITY_DN10269_c0_g1_i1.p1 TRINITY_DN10269_c0_g1~~TRINITY_DN10269_c0_g1_i1.p1  ORF type:complete len:157 (+),score=28.68 TRINITY_DN10269_c0_g1_i1:69-539(+)